jgi:hypothetical protein
MLTLIGIMLVAALFLWFLSNFPLDAWIMNMIRAVVVLVLALYILAFLGLIPHGMLPGGVGRFR